MLCSPLFILVLEIWPYHMVGSHNLSWFFRYDHVTINSPHVTICIFVGLQIIIMYNFSHILGTIMFPSLMPQEWLVAIVDLIATNNRSTMYMANHFKMSLKCTFVAVTQATDTTGLKQAIGSRNRTLNPWKDCPARSGVWTLDTPKRLCLQSCTRFAHTIAQTIVRNSVLTKTCAECKNELHME